MVHMPGELWDWYIEVEKSGFDIVEVSRLLEFGRPNMTAIPRVMLHFVLQSARILMSSICQQEENRVASNLSRSL